MLYTHTHTHTHTILRSHLKFNNNSFISNIPSVFTFPRLSEICLFSQPLRWFLCMIKLEPLLLRTQGEKSNFSLGGSREKQGVGSLETISWEEAAILHLGQWRTGIKKPNFATPTHLNRADPLESRLTWAKFQRLNSGFAKQSRKITTENFGRHHQCWLCLPHQISSGGKRSPCPN